MLYTEGRQLYGVVVMVQVICEHFGITSGAIEVGCDGQIALWHAFGRGPKFDPDIKDVDYVILSAIRKLFARSARLHGHGTT
jgi:hypothetical protein